MSELRCFSENKILQRCPSDRLVTSTFRDQFQTEEKILDKFQKLKFSHSQIPRPVLLLEREKHIRFLLLGLENLSQSYECLDASRPWICYWILQSLSLLEVNIDPSLSSRIVRFLKQCQEETGGFGGGPYQLAHLAPTYAAINALLILQTEEALKVIDRESLYSFLRDRIGKDGSVTMHDEGEIDIRGAYCALSAAKLTGIFTPELFPLVGKWIASCQTYEGGFAGTPLMEAHGGYSFCGLGALVILGEDHLCDIPRLLRWTAKQQLAFEGGFRGRTNKLVDGCYSFWQGGAFPLIQMILTARGDQNLSAENWMFDQELLQEFLLVCCQNSKGGLVDKPGKPRDYYHTCYCLSGLSVAQHVTAGSRCFTKVVGHASNLLKPTHPVFNISYDAVNFARDFFKEKPLTLPQEDG